jgi:hypothetical protein
VVEVRKERDALEELDGCFLGHGRILRHCLRVDTRDGAFPIATERERDGGIEGQGTAFGTCLLEIRPGELENPCFARIAVAPPATERRSGLLSFDRTPQPSRTLLLAALGGYPGEDPDSEGAACSVVKSLGHRERFARMRLPWSSRPALGRARLRGARRPRHA